MTLLAEALKAGKLPESWNEIAERPERTVELHARYSGDAATDASIVYTDAKYKFAVWYFCTLQEGEYIQTYRIQKEWPAFDELLDQDAAGMERSFFLLKGNHATVDANMVPGVSFSAVALTPAGMDANKRGFVYKPNDDATSEGYSLWLGFYDAPIVGVAGGTAVFFIAAFSHASDVGSANKLAGGTSCLITAEVYGP